MEAFQGYSAFTAATADKGGSDDSDEEEDYVSRLDEQVILPLHPPHPRSPMHAAAQCRARRGAMRRRTDATGPNDATRPNATRPMRPCAHALAPMRQCPTHLPLPILQLEEMYADYKQRTQRRVVAALKEDEFDGIHNTRHLHRYAPRHAPPWHHRTPRHATPHSPLILSSCHPSSAQGRARMRSGARRARRPRPSWRPPTRRSSRGRWLYPPRPSRPHVCMRHTLACGTARHTRERAAAGVKTKTIDPANRNASDRFDTPPTLTRSGRPPARALGPIPARLARETPAPTPSTHPRGMPPPLTTI